MKAAPCSWRVGTKRTDESASESRMSRISSPGRPKTYCTPSFSRQRTIRSDPLIGSGDPDRLDVHELTDAVLGELPPVARALDPAERQAWIRLHESIHEDRAGLDLRGHALGAGAILGPDRGAEAERRVVGEAHGLGFVPGPDHRGDRAEGLLVEGRHALVHGGQQRRRIEGARAGRDLAAEETPGPALDRLLDLPVQRVPETDAGLRPDLRVARERIADAAGAELLDEPLDELVGDRFDDDEALGRDAALADLGLAARPACRARADRRRGGSGAPRRTARRTGRRSIRRR